LFYIGSIFYLGTDGVHNATPVWNWKV